MPYDRQHLVMQWGGTLPGGEIWSNSMRLAGNPLGDDPLGVMTYEDIEEWLHGELKDEVQAWHTSSGAHINMYCALTYLKLNYVNMAGHYIDPNTHEHVYNPAPVGNYSGNQPPNQVTLAISLTTGAQRGWAHRGRFYMPLPAVQIQPDGRISEGVATEIANAAKTFVEAVADTPGLDNLVSPDPVVMSSRGQGTTRFVTGLEVGRVLDTQRRRRAEIPESWVAVPINN